jgi:uncharacterized integral membrane protein
MWANGRFLVSKRAVRMVTTGLQRVVLHVERIIIIIIIIIIISITFTQCIYNYTPETNHVPTVYNVAAVL